jgi:hypothetical protein
VEAFSEGVEEIMKKHDITGVRFEGDRLVISISGKENAFDLGTVSEKLKSATDVQRKNFEVSPSGYGIHWPMLEEDLSIDGLLGIVHVPDKMKKSA